MMTTVPIKSSSDTSFAVCSYVIICFSPKIIDSFVTFQ